MTSVAASLFASLTTLPPAGVGTSAELGTDVFGGLVGSIVPAPVAWGAPGLPPADDARLPTTPIATLLATAAEGPIAMLPVVAAVVPQPAADVPPAETRDGEAVVQSAPQTSIVVVRPSPPANDTQPAPAPQAPTLTGPQPAVPSRPSDDSPAAETLRPDASPIEKPAENEKPVAVARETKASAAVPAATPSVVLKPTAAPTVSQARREVDRPTAPATLPEAATSGPVIRPDHVDVDEHATLPMPDADADAPGPNPVGVSSGPAVDAEVPPSPPVTGTPQTAASLVAGCGDEPVRDLRPVAQPVAQPAPAAVPVGRSKPIASHAELVTDRPERSEQDRPAADEAETPLPLVSPVTQPVATPVSVALRSVPEAEQATPDTGPTTTVAAPSSSQPARAAPAPNDDLHVAPAPDRTEGPAVSQRLAPPTERAPDTAPPRIETTPPIATAPQSLAPDRAVPTPADTITAQPGRIGQELGVAIARHVAGGPAAASGGGDTITLRLNPVDMGRIEVTLSFDDSGTLRAVVSTDNPVAMELLRRDSADLGRALIDAGLRADAQTLRFDTRAGNGQGGNQGGQGQPWQRQPDTARGTTPDTASAPHDDITAAYRPLRTRGGIDMVA